MMDKRITIAVAALFMGALVAALFAPIDGEHKAQIMVILGGLGMSLTAALRGLLEKREGPPRQTIAPREPRRRTRTEGRASPLLLGTLAVLGAAALVASLLSGCGASVVRQHATAATLATVAIAGAGSAIEVATAGALAECPDGAAGLPCVADVERVAETAAGARDSLLPLLSAYRDAIETGALAGDDASVVAALGVMGLRLVREWPALVEALAALGVTLPALSVPGGEP